VNRPPNRLSYPKLLAVGWLIAVTAMLLGSVTVAPGVAAAQAGDEDAPAEADDTAPSDDADDDAGDDEAAEEEGVEDDAAEGEAGEGEAGEAAPADGEAAAVPPAAAATTPPSEGGAAAAPAAPTSESAAGAGGADALAAPTVVGDDEEPEADAAPSEEAAPAEEEAAAAPREPSKPVTHNWRNSFFFWTNNLNVYSLVPEGNLTYNPTYSWAFSIQPRWYLGPSLFIRLRQDATVEWTDSDFRSLNREFVLNDTQLTLLEGNLASIAGVTFSAGGSLIFPTSIASQSNTMIIGAQGFGLARYTFRDVLNGLILIGSAGYTYRHFDQNVPQFEDGDDFLVNLGRQGNTDINGALSGTLLNQPHSLGLGISATLVATPKLFFSTSFSWNRGWAFGAAGGCVPLEGTGDSREEARDPDQCDGEQLPDGETASRDSTFFSVGASYQFNKWLNVGLSIGTSRLYFIDGFDDRNTFFNRGSTISLTTQITLDQLYNDLAGGEEAQAPMPGQPF